MKIYLNLQQRESIRNNTVLGAFIKLHFELLKCSRHFVSLSKIQNYVRRKTLWLTNKFKHGNK